MEDHKEIVKKLIKSFDNASEDLQIYITNLSVRHNKTDESSPTTYNRSLFDSIVKEPDEILGQYQNAVYSLDSFFDFIIGRKVNFDHAELSKIELEFLENFLVRLWLLFEPEFNLVEINTKDLIKNILKMNLNEFKKKNITVSDSYAKPSTYNTVPVLFIKSIKLIVGHFLRISSQNSTIIVNTSRKNIDNKYRLIFTICSKNNKSHTTADYTNSKNNEPLNTQTEIFNLLLCSQIIKHLNGKLIIESPEKVVPSFKLIF